LNNGTVPVTLTLSTQDWNPIEASSYMTLSWDYAGAILNSTETMSTTLTLIVGPDVSGITEFQFNIIITATET
jgi:uncharacterized membrane protein